MGAKLELRAMGVLMGPEAHFRSRRARAKPQKMPTNASCAPWQETMTNGRKSQEALPDTA
jgi:hypothetical protein